jgi:SAM-dependent methyltransferase
LNTDYLSVVYSEKSKPKSDYPSKLVNHLISKFEIKPGSRLLEAGCGTGNFLQCFGDQNIRVSGCDLSPMAGVDLKNVSVQQCDIEAGPFPYESSAFDVVYSKSLIEHLAAPTVYLNEVMRILKPGGLCLTLTPDWESNYKIFFDDPTHIRPFTKVSLQRAYEMAGFENVGVELFRQLPIVWEYPFVGYICAALAPFTPVRTKQKFLRWGRELMLLGSARKPQSSK